jgi:hypothetical protein
MDTPKFVALTTYLGDTEYVNVSAIWKMGASQRKGSGSWIVPRGVTISEYCVEEYRETPEQILALVASSAQE